MTILLLIANEKCNCLYIAGNNTNSEVSDIGSPHMYFLQVDSSYNLSVDDPQVFPLHILNSTSEYNQSFRLKQKQEERHNQCELLFDVCQEPASKEDKSYQEYQKRLLSPTPLQCITPKQLSAEISETELITPGQTIIAENKEQLIQNYVHISDRNVAPRAIAVLPSVLQIRRTDVISPRRTLPPRTRFGPVQGIRSIMEITGTNEVVLMAIGNKIPLFMVKDKANHVNHIDVSDKDKSNWIGLLPLGDEHTANLWLYEENHELYVITTEAVPSRKQLMLGYSKKYAQDYGLIGPCKDIMTETSSKQKSWWCYECQRAMPTAIDLQRHIDADHEEDVSVPKRTYRCRYCSRTFSRIFTLRRHVSLHCEKKLAKSNNINTTEALTEPALNTTLNSDDNRVPSDESFQNYSNSLDFSTNLFDTDRMPSLDISGSSRSEIFTPYGLDSESALANDLGYENGCSKTDISSSDDKKKQQDKDIKPPLETCPYCNQDVLKGKKRLHVSECPARRFECECKKVFTNKELLAQHIYTVHSNEAAEEQKLKEENTTNNINVESQSTAPYSCEQCQHTFKRRGMLVNHLWNVHGASAARVPLARRVRHYPCGVCPKLYRAAAKRDRHVAAHHPGAAQVRLSPVEGGSRECAPAACCACPRQYATRAKLLQHQRYHHPHLVPPPKKPNLTQKSNKKNDRTNAAEEILKHKASLQQLLNFY